MFDTFAITRDDVSVMIKIKYGCSTITYSSAIMFIIVHYIITIFLLAGIIDDHRAIVTDHNYRRHLESSFLGRLLAQFFFSLFQYFELALLLD
jgi:hypothetical protein